MKKLILINSQQELDYVNQKKKYKDYLKLILQPEIEIKEDKKILFLEKFKSKNFFKASIFFRKKLDNVLKKINIKFIKYFNLPNINFITYYGNHLKSLINVVIFHQDAINNLVKKNRIKHVVLFKYVNNNDNLDNFYLDIIKSLKIEIKINFIKLNIKDNTIIKKKFSNLVPSYIDEKFSIKREFINQIKIKNISKKNKQNLLFTNYSKNMQNIANILSAKFNIIFYDKIFFRYTSINQNQSSLNSFVNILKKENSIYNEFIFYKNFQTADIVMNFIQEKINEIININLFHFNKINYILKKYKLSGIISEYETNKTIQICDQSKYKVINLFFSHGGTAGHYLNWPQVNIYNRDYHKNIFYQAFSKKIKNYLLKNFRRIKRKPINLLTLPNIDHLKYKDIKKSKKNSKKIKIAYFCTTYSGNYESKVGIHDDYKLYLLREEIKKKIIESRNIQLNVKPGYNNRNIKIKFLNGYDSNISYYKDDYPNEKIFEENDIIVCEVNSTTMVEALYTNLPIIIFKKDYPKFLNISKKLLKNRILFLNKEKDILKTFDKIDNNSKKISTNFNKDFIKLYYNIKNLNIEHIKLRLYRLFS